VSRILSRATLQRKLLIPRNAKDALEICALHALRARRIVYLLCAFAPSRDIFHA